MLLLDNQNFVQNEVDAIQLTLYTYKGSLHKKNMNIWKKLMKIVQHICNINMKGT